MFRIRRAEKSDAKVIAEFQQKMAFESEGFELDPVVLEKGVRAVFDNHSKGMYFVVENNKSIIASMLITYEWSDWRNKTIYWLQSIYVIPRMRGKKVFSLMYKHIKEMADKDDSVGGIRLYVDNSNKNAIGVYKAVGMHDEHYRTFEWMKQ